MNKVEAACETFREHLASEVADELKKLQLRLQLKKGLKGFSSLAQVNDLISISEKPVITTGDVDLIIKTIVRHDSPEFGKNYPAFSNALQKFRAVSELKANAHDSNKFQSTYQHNQSVFETVPDGQTIQFLQTIRPALRNYNQDRLFSTDIVEPTDDDKKPSRKYTK
jgi:hypothetical protein